MFFFLGGGRWLQRGEFIRFKGGSFTTIEFQRGFDRTPRTSPPTRLKYQLCYLIKILLKINYKNEFSKTKGSQFIDYSGALNKWMAQKLNGIIFAR